MLPLNALVILYTLTTSVMISLSKANQKKRLMFLLINAGIIVWLSIPICNPTTIIPPLLHLIFDWSPLLSLPLLYKETAILTTGFGRGSYDSLFIQFEEKYFPRIMRLHHQNRGNSTLLSEYLHLCYLSFYLFIYGIPLYFYLNHEWLAFYQSVFVILFILFSCYLTHALIPAFGPRNIFDKISDKRSKGVFFRLVHKILEGGSTPGTAFPSGHVGAACVVILITFYWNLSLFYCILPIAIGLIISTVYGRFHYVIDVILGGVYALIAFAFTLWVYHRFTP